MIVHIWASSSRWPSGLPHAECSKDLVDLAYAIPAGSTPAEIRLILSGLRGRLCRRCEKEADIRYATRADS